MQQPLTGVQYDIIKTHKIYPIFEGDNPLSEVEIMLKNTQSIKKTVKLLMLHEVCYAFPHVELKKTKQ